jgi:hypothetical protein
MMLNCELALVFSRQEVMNRERDGLTFWALAIFRPYSFSSDLRRSSKVLAPFSALYISFRLVSQREGERRGYKKQMEEGTYRAKDLIFPNPWTLLNMIADFIASSTLSNSVENPNLRSSEMTLQVTPF